MVQDIEVPVVEQGHVEPRPVGEGLDDLNAVVLPSTRHGARH